jgi:aminopeptidase
MTTKGASKVMECFGVKRGESVLIVVDTSTPTSISKSLFEAARDIGCEVMILTMLPRSRHGEELPPAVAEAMMKADVVIAPTTMSLTHTQARINACKAGARIASMPGITESMMSSGGITADCRKLNDRALVWNRRLTNIREVRVISDIGTDITFDLEGCTWMMDTGMCHEMGSSSNLPAGEMYIAPKDANGVFVVDGSLSGFGLLDSPIRITVRNRYVTSIKGEHADA